LEASPATTFRACSSPAPTAVKPQPAPAIFSQESVHTTLSITDHTRKRPSTGPRTTHGPQHPHAYGGACLPSALANVKRVSSSCRRHRGEVARRQSSPVIDAIGDTRREGPQWRRLSWSSSRRRRCLTRMGSKNGVDVDGVI
jgi:hypothetical protein